jgi:hypothetical protein
LVHANSGVVVDIARFCEANDRVDEDIGLVRSCRTDGEFSMGTVHWIAGLEGDNTGPMEFSKVSSELRGSDWLLVLVQGFGGRGGGRVDTSILDVIVVIEPVHGLQCASYIIFLCFYMQVVHCRVIEVMSSENL